MSCDVFGEGRQYATRTPATRTTQHLGRPRLGREGKFFVKTSSWEDNRTILDGEKLQIQNVEAHWEIVRVPATVTVLPRLGMSGL